MPDSFSSIGKLLIIGGVIFIVVGIVLTQHDKIPFIGKLPGDILVKRKNFTFYFPVVTSILISLLLTLILYVINRFRS
jgi:hypothetical protein